MSSLIYFAILYNSFIKLLKFNLTFTFIYFFQTTVYQARISEGITPGAENTALSKAGQNPALMEINSCSRAEN